MIKNRVLEDIIAGRALLTVAPDDFVAQAARLMEQHNRGAVLVVDGGRLCGIFTERDMVCRVVAKGLLPDATPLKQVMSTSLIVAHPHDDHIMALSKMNAGRVRHLPVVKESQVIGMVSRRELMALNIELLEEDLDRREAYHLFI
jgi:CBS domain-containing protein